MENIYEAPKADLADVSDSAVEGSKFYVVSLFKFVILYAATMGLYSVYWFYRHWTDYRISTGTKLWAVPRAIFSIFFAHSLFRHFDEEVPEASALGHSAAPMATVYVLAHIGQTVIDRVVGAETGISLTTDVVLSCIGMGLMVVVAWSIWRAQRVANLACNDPQGSSNESLGAANIAWIVAGGLFWMLVLFGFYQIFLGLPQ